MRSTLHLAHPRNLGRTCLKASLAGIGLAALLAAAGAAEPAAPGSDPGPSCWPGSPGTDPTLCPPNDPGYRRHWEYRGDIPSEIDRSKVHPAELALGSIGVSLDRAWQLTTGRPDVLIAVLDSGIRWSDRELTEKLYLNAGELPPPRGSAAGYDMNGDSLVTAADYAEDPRVADSNGNGFIDPGDLIRAFSNCQDDDGNGYRDDISGYDFFSGEHCGTHRGDNDPDDETDFGHGTAIATTIAAPTHDGQGEAGVCARCRVLPVRVGDSFVVDANQFADGLIFAVRSGARVVASALGSYNNTPFARSAVDYAYEHGVAIIASAADEFSYHHNFPSVYNHALYVNAICHDQPADYRKATTFWGLNPCTNFGARVWVTVPARTCSSGATSRLAGISGLVLSAALDSGSGPLAPEELYQLLRMTTDDLDNSEPDWGELRWPARAGFDQLTGYGRVNAQRVVQAAIEGRIPPQADLTSPDWFSIVSPRRPLPIHGSIHVERASRAVWELAYAPGVEPTEQDYTVVATGQVEGERVGPLGQLDFKSLRLPPGPSPSNRDERDRLSATVRLRVSDVAGLVAEARRSFFVVDDPSWKPGFPLPLRASGEAAPLFADIDGDGDDEIVLPTADGFVRIVSWASGTPQVALVPLDERERVGPLPDGLAPRESVIRAAAVGELGASRKRSIVVASREGKVYAFDAEGDRLPGFPVSIADGKATPATPARAVESGILSSPVLADLDGRPGLEIVVAALDGRLHVWRGDGRTLPGFPVRIAGSQDEADHGAKLVSTPVVGDIDGDGRPEIILGSNRLREGQAAAFAVRAEGTTHPAGAFVPGWAPFELPALRPDLLPTLATGVSMTPLLADVDGDGDSEVVLYAVTGSAIVLVDQAKEAGPRVVARFSLAPAADSALQGTTFLGGDGSALVADTDHDGARELYAPLFPFRMLTLRAHPGVPLDVPLALGGWELRSGGESPVPMLSGFPRRMEDLMLWARPAAADVDGDGAQEVLMGSGGYLLHAFARGGGEAATFPKFTGGWIFSAPAVGDLDGDGRLELAAVTREGYLFVWQLAGTNGGVRSAAQSSSSPISR